jgi:hypothetical protein
MLLRSPSRALALAAGLLAAAATVGCGGGAPGAPSTPSTDARQPGTSGRLIPLSVGATWTWKASDTLTGLTGTSSSTVEGVDMLTGANAGISAFRVRSTTLSGSTVNWQQDTGSATIRHREEFLDPSGAVTSDHLYLPGKLRLDEAPAHLALNATWTETYSDQVTASSTPRVQPTTTITVSWTVEAVDEVVTVPAGTFTCVRLHSVESGTAGYDSHFWYARNVGKVKESGTEVRDLTGYIIP